MCCGVRTKRICLECGKSFFQEEGTLAMKKKSYNNCPYCGGSSKKDLEHSEQLRKKQEEKWSEYERLAGRLNRI